jgi:hypothetical protein
MVGNGAQNPFVPHHLGLDPMKVITAVTRETRDHRIDGLADVNRIGNLERRSIA